MKIKLSISIMAHPSRVDFVNFIKEKMNEDIHVEWDRGMSLWDTSRRAWLSYDPSATHHLVLQDDIIPSKDLRATIEKALSYNFECPVSIFLGNYRLNPENERLYRNHYKRGVPWFKHSTSLGGCGIIVPTKFIRDMIAAGDKMEVPADDAKIEAFFKSIQVPIWNTVPSLIQHRDGNNAPSLAQTGKDWKDRGAIIFIGEDKSGLDLDWTKKEIPPFDLR